MTHYNVLNCKIAIEAESPEFTGLFFDAQKQAGAGFSWGRTSTLPLFFLPSMKKKGCLACHDSCWEGENVPGIETQGWGRGDVREGVIGSDGMNFYKTTAWKKKREKILRRDEYLCRECRRYGKTTPATTVHHVYPAEQYPEWRLENWNLISLCDSCHNAMHDRDSGKLTAFGQGWADRTSPHPLGGSHNPSGTGAGNLFQ